MADSPHEYIEQLKLENKILRRSLIEVMHEKQVLEDTATKLANAVVKLRDDVAARPRFRPDAGD